MPGHVRNFVASNLRWSRWLNERLDADSRRIDGCQDFTNVLSEYLYPGMRVLDVGGGRRPAISADVKAAFRLNVVGLDVSRAELEGAPSRAYDEIVVGDVSACKSLPQVDLAISRSVTEHVRDPRAMYANLYGALRPGGRTLDFMPNKFALFALLNVIVPVAISNRLLNFFYPEMGETHFRAYYRKCYAPTMHKLMRQIGYEDVGFRLYYRSDYFSFFAPLHFLELCWQLTTSHFNWALFCETFTMSARKPGRETP